MPNEAERRRWNDEQMVAGWPKRERFTDAVVPHVVAALDPQPGEKVVDIGCGGGRLSIAIAEKVRPGGKVTGADISAGMLALASGRAADAKAKNTVFSQADVQVDKVPGGPFDAATSQFGVMFFEDPVAAFTNVRKSLKRGGRLAFACWQPGAKNNWCTVPVLAPFAPPPPPRPEGMTPTGPFAFGDPKYTRNILISAGFVEVRRMPKKLVVRVPADSIGDDSMMPGLGVPPEKRAEASKALQKHLARFQQPDGMCRVELNIQIFQANVG
jgi:SAM-dependent methyltransferase